MTEMQIRFGAASSIESLHVGSSEAEMRNGVEQILESVKRRATAYTEVRHLYDELPLSLHLFGERFGKNAYIGLVSLAQEDGQAVKCSTGTPQERKQALLALQACVSVVVDLSAIATIRMIGLEGLLDTKRFHFQMTEGTWNELQDTLLGDRFSSVTGGTLSHDAGVTAFIQETPEERAKSRQRDKAFLDRIRGAIEVVPVIELANLEPEKRESLEKMFGQYGAETMMLASHADVVLWTDNLIQGQIAANEFDVRRAWTQVLVEQIAQVGQITDAEGDRAAAALVGLEYVVTTFDRASLLSAVEMSNATAWRWPLKQFVEVFRKPSGDVQGLLGIFVEFLSKLYREPYLPESRCKVVTALLDGLWSNVPLRLPLLRLRRASDQFFGFNPVGKTQFDQCFDQWQRTVTETIVSL